MPAGYTVSRSRYTVRLIRTTDYTGGLVLSAFASDGLQLRVTSDEPPLAVPGYGACRAYYEVEHASGLLFFDLCPNSLDRSFELSFNVHEPDGAVSAERIPYSVRSNGLWWTPDSL